MKSIPTTLIDTRFPPPIKRVKVPLYPLQTHTRPLFVLKKKGASFISFLENYYQTSQKSLILADKASMALSLFLHTLALDQSELKVGFPAFCCREVCQAVLAAGCTPVFLELDEHFFFTETSLNFAANTGCKVLIWPQFFGTRQLPKEISLMIKKFGFIFINDEAQSFPELEERPCIEADATLFSLGPTKKLAGIGGGGICIHNPALIRKKPFELQSSDLSLWQEVQNALKAKLRRFDYSIAQFLDRSFHLESDLKALLEKRPVIPQSFPLKKISSLQCKVAYDRLVQYQKKSQNFLEYVQKIKKSIGEVLGERATNWIDPIKYPSIFAVDLLFNKQEMTRRQFFEFFSKNKIQSTWYYFPLNQLSFLQKYISEPIQISMKIAANILILPVNWTHPPRMRRNLEKTIALLSYADRNTHRS